MKKLILASALSMAGLVCGTAFAQTTSAPVDVSVALTAKCRVQTGSGNALSFAYTAFQPGAAAATPISITFECTRNYASPTIAFDVVNGTNAGVGVLAGLQYALSTSAAVTTPGTAAGTGVGALGTPATIAYSVGGSIPAGQAGDSTAGITHTRQLILAF